MAQGTLQLEQIEAAFEQIKQLFASKGEELDEEGAAKLLGGSTPPLPSFPILIVALAVTKDFLDMMSFTLIGLVFVMPFSIGVAIILMFWCLGKIHGGWWKKRMIRWLWMRYVIAILIEFIPFVQFIIPATTIFVLMAHYKETKVVQLMNEGLELLHSGGAGPIARSSRIRFGPRPSSNNERGRMREAA